jgi:hypothetical protein
MGGDSIEVLLRKVKWEGKDSDEILSEGKTGLLERRWFRKVLGGFARVARRCRGSLQSPR